MNKVLLFNPLSTTTKPRIPNAILNIAASIDGIYDWAFVEGNFESDAYSALAKYLDTGEYKYIGFTVMPGPQMKQSIPLAKQIKKDYPDTVMIWGGYFPSIHYKVILESGYVDFVIKGPGDNAFPQLLHALENGTPYELIKNLIFKFDGQILKATKEDLIDQDTLAPLPYDKLDSFYPLRKYMGKTYLGKKTFSYHSSIGCPFTCSFCAVVPIYEARWKAKSAQHVYNDVKYAKDKWGADAVEFHDNNFFVSEKRAIAFAELIKPEKMKWWGMARIDTMSRYKDSTLQLLSDAGCAMIFFGAESGNNELLKEMDKGGTQTGDQILAFAERLKKYNIVPEYSFVLGTPASTPEKVTAQIDFEIDFIKQVKKANPKTEIIIYTYSPVPTEGSDLYNHVLEQGFRYPKKLEDWISSEWESFDLRKKPLTPWLTPEMINKIRDFETVLNGYYPTVSDIRMSNLKRKVIRLFASLRYKTNFYWKPYELKVLQIMWKYRQPEIEGL